MVARHTAEMRSLEMVTNDHRRDHRISRPVPLDLRQLRRQRLAPVRDERDQYASRAVTPQRVHGPAQGFTAQRRILKIHSGKAVHLQIEKRRGCPV